MWSFHSPRYLAHDGRHEDFPSNKLVWSLNCLVVHGLVNLCMMTLSHADSALGPDVTGWSPNAKNVLAPRVIDLGTSMDPQHFAASAADLNIRLMKWRAAPSLDVDKLAATKCLLLGAGTPNPTRTHQILTPWGMTSDPKAVFLESLYTLSHPT